MTKLLIFTNADSLSNLEEDFHAVLREHAFPTKKRPVVLVKEDHAGVSIGFVDDFKNEGLYLIYDKIDERALELLSDQCKDDDVYALVHTYPVWKDRIREIAGNERFREGNHIPGNQYYYYPVFECLTDSGTDKIERIRDLLRLSEAERVRRAIQKFIIGCNTPYNDAPLFLQVYEELRSIDAFKKKVEGFYKDKYPNKDKKGETPTRNLLDYSAELASLSGFLRHYQL